MDTGVVYLMVRSETIGLARASRLSVCMINDYGFERVEYEYFDAHYHIEYAFKFKIIRIDLAAGVSNPSLYLTLNVGLYSTTMLKCFFLKKQLASCKLYRRGKNYPRQCHDDDRPQHHTH